MSTSTAAKRGGGRGRGMYHSIIVRAFTVPERSSSQIVGAQLDGAGDVSTHRTKMH
jgi:hypothetical protein